MSLCRFFGSRNTILKLLTSVSVHGWSYMAKIRNFDVKLYNFVKKWYIFTHCWLITCLYRGVWVSRQTFEAIWNSCCQFLYMVGPTWQNGIILMQHYIVWLENGFIFINYWLVIHLHKKVFSQETHIWNSLHQFLYMGEGIGKNIRKMKNNQQKLDLPIVVRITYM